MSCLETHLHYIFARAIFYRRFTHARSLLQSDARVRKKRVKYILHTAWSRGNYFLHTNWFLQTFTHSCILSQSDARVRKKSVKACKNTILHTHAFGARGTHTFLHTRNERVKRSTPVFLGAARAQVPGGPGSHMHLLYLMECFKYAFNILNMTDGMF